MELILYLVLLPQQEVVVVNGVSVQHLTEYLVVLAVAHVAVLGVLVYLVKAMQGVLVTIQLFMLVVAVAVQELLEEVLQLDLVVLVLPLLLVEL
jgi:hypothetical protein